MRCFVARGDKWNWNAAVLAGLVAGLRFMFFG